MFVYLVEYLSKAVQRWTFVWRDGFFVVLFFKLQIVSLLVISVFKLFLFDSVLAGCKFLETCPFLLGCSVYWHIMIVGIKALRVGSLMFPCVCPALKMPPEARLCGHRGPTCHLCSVHGSA